MNNLQADGWDLTDLKYVEIDDETKQHFLLEQGDILFNRTNSKELVGKCDVFREQGEWVFASYLIRVRVDESKVRPQFISDFLNTHAGRVQIDRVSRQIIGMSNVNAEELRELLILLPPIAIQDALVAELNQAREVRRRKLAEAESLLASFDDWLLVNIGLTLPPIDTRRVFAMRLAELCASERVDALYHLPKYRAVEEAVASCPHPIKSLGQISEPPVGGATPLRANQELYASSGIRFLRIMNIRPNEIDLSDVKFITPAVHEGELKRSQLAENDVLMTITGRVGTAAVVTGETLPANINQHIVRLRIRDSDCLPEFLAAYLNTSLGLAISNRNVTGGTRIALDYGAIESLPVPCPPLRVQETVVAELRSRREQARRLCTEAETEWQAAKQQFEEQLLKRDKP